MKNIKEASSLYLLVFILALPLLICTSHLDTANDGIEETSNYTSTIPAVTSITTVTEITAFESSLCTTTELTKCTTTSIVEDTTITTTTEQPVSSTMLVDQSELAESHVDENEQVTEVTNEPKYTTDNSTLIYYQDMEGTYYCGGEGTYGRWGRDLISGYSVAINGLDDGTIVYIESECPGITGTYRVDDTGGMGNYVVDFYYQRGNVPSEFSWRGRVPIKVWIVS